MFILLVCWRLNLTDTIYDTANWRKSLVIANNILGFRPGAMVATLSVRRPSKRQEDPVDKKEVTALFAHLEHGDGEKFFEHVADDVDWTVEGTHPLAGHYHSKKDFLAGTFDKLAKVLPEGTQLATRNVLVDGDWAIVELRSRATARNGMRFDNHYCWLCRFADGRIVEVRAYLDSWLVGELFRENPI